MNIKSKLFAERDFLSAFLFLQKKFVYCPKSRSENLKFVFVCGRIQSHKTKRTVS